MLVKPKSISGQEREQRSMVNPRVMEDANVINIVATNPKLLV